MRTVYAFLLNLLDIILFKLFQSLSNFVIDTIINGNRTLCRTIRATHSTDLKSLARFLPELRVVRGESLARFTNLKK